MCRINKFIEPESRLVLARDSGVETGGEGGWKGLVIDEKVTFWGDENNWHKIVMMITQSCEYTKTH